MEEFKSQDATLLYSYDSFKEDCQTPKERFIKNIKSPVGIYLAAVILFMTFWLLYSLVSGLCGSQPATFIISFLPTLFAYFVGTFIIVISVCGLWSRFMRFALHKNLVKPRDRQSVEMQADAMEASENKEKALYIYEDRVLLYDFGKLTEMKTDDIYKVDIEKKYKTLEVYFFKKGQVKLFSGLPSTDLDAFVSIFGDKVEIEDKEKRKRDKELYGSYKARRAFDITGDKVGGFIMGLIAVGAGVAVICLHFYVTDKIPWFLGVFFILGGVLVVFTTMHGFPIVRVFIIPLFFGILFTVAPSGIAVIVTEAKEEKLPISSFTEFLKGCSPLLMVGLLLTAIGVLLLVLSVIRLVKYIKYGEE